MTMSILEAACSGNVNEITRLLRDGMSINVKDEGGQTALINACTGKHTTCFELLLERGADIEAIDSKNNTVLCTAAFLGQETHVQLLISYGAITSVVNSDGDSPLMLALKNGHASCAKLLLKAMNNVSIHFINRKGANALILAAKGGFVDILQDLLSKNADFNIKDNEEKTALLWASYQGHSECLKALIQVGACLYNTDDDSETALTLAAVEGHLECVKILLDNGMDVNGANDYLITPLMYAAFSQNLDCVKLLLQAGANVNVVNKSKETVLCMASFGKNVEVVNALLEAGADVEINEIAEIRGLTPLMSAAREGYTDLLKCYLSKEDKDKKTDNIHYKSLMYTLECVRPECLSILLEDDIFDWKWFSHVKDPYYHKMLLKAIINTSMPLGLICQDNQEFTPLQFALLNHDIAMVKYLLANMCITDYDYKSLQQDSKFLSLILNLGTPEIKQFVKEFQQTLWPLSTLSFLTVSSSVGHHKNRNTHLESLPLPDFFKRKLKFQSHISNLCIKSWNNIFDPKPVLFYENLPAFLNVCKPIWPTEDILITCKSEYCCAGNGVKILFQPNEES